MQPRDFLSYYATQFHTVELDNTFYKTPAISTVEGWNAKTLPGFVFAANHYADHGPATAKLFTDLLDRK